VTYEERIIKASIKNLMSGSLATAPILHGLLTVCLASVSSKLIGQISYKNVKPSDQDEQMASRKPANRVGPNLFGILQILNK